MGRAIPLKQVFAKPLMTSYPKSDHISTRCRIHAGKEQGHQRWTRSCQLGIISKLCCLLKPPSYARIEQLLETITLTVLNFKVVFQEFWGATKAVLELYRLQGLLNLKCQLVGRMSCSADISQISLPCDLTAWPRWYLWRWVEVSWPRCHLRNTLSPQSWWLYLC